jgi:hypothetical protein
MTTGTGPDVLAAARRRAAGLLGVPEDASGAEARRAYLRQLRENDFVPPRAARQALHVLGGGPALPETDEEAVLEEEGRLRAEVDSFAQEFFDVPVARRRERWQALLSWCRQVPPLVARLSALKAGLALDKQRLYLDDSPPGQLVAHLVEAFPLSPLARAAARQDFLRPIEKSSAADDSRDWEKAARSVRDAWPDVAALDDELVDHLAELRRRLKRRVIKPRRSEESYTRASVGGGNRNSWWAFFVVGGILMGLVRGFIGCNTGSSRWTPSPPPSPPSAVGLKDLGKVRGGLGGDEAAKKPWLFRELPPLSELVDPAKFDVEILRRAGAEFLRFTPRAGAAITWPDGLRADGGAPLVVAETTLQRLGATREQLVGLRQRAEARQRGNVPADLPPQAPGGPART